MWSSIEDAPELRMTDNVQEADVVVCVGKSRGWLGWTVFEGDVSDCMPEKARVILSPMLALCGEDERQWVVAHELGHVLGLSYIATRTVERNRIHGSNLNTLRNGDTKEV